jgi:hypothetical protein
MVLQWVAQGMACMVAKSEEEEVGADIWAPHFSHLDVAPTYFFIFFLLTRMPHQ